MNRLKSLWPDLLCVLLFAAVAWAYFMPADLQGRILYREDASAGRGASHEQKEYYEKTGERTRWTNATFSGMPTYQTAPSYGSTDLLQTAVKAWHLWLPEYVWYLFAYLLGFYLLLRAFDFRQELAALGALIWAFSSYFIIIIAAGHIWKVMALAYLPAMIAGVVWAYRGRWLLGMVVTAVFTAFEVNANHVQMTYYYLMVIGLMVIGWLIEAVREKRMGQWAKATAACAVGAAIGIGINASNLYHTWQYGKESMRSKSELSSKEDANNTSSGLDRDYITQWSYGVDETLTLLVPNAKGGASVPMAANERAMKKANPEFNELYRQIGQYWGEQPGTSGPVYVGALVLLLFFIGLFVVKGPMKWALVVATVLSVMLSWGKNFMPLTDFFIDYVPMYAKFRTVASILVVAEFSIPLLAMMALKKIYDDPELLRRNRKAVWISYGLTAGVALVMAVAPSLLVGDMLSSNEVTALKSLPTEYFIPVTENLKAMRKAVVSADAWRSFWIITLGIAALLAFGLKRMKRGYLVAIIAAVCLIDLWTVDKRYLNDDMFVEKTVRDMPQQLIATDRQILADNGKDYRVLNMATNTFNENETSYYHKSIGGYHAAKLRRYQELIEHHISPEMESLMSAIVDAQGDMTQVKGDSLCRVLNMLNTKYVIVPLQGGQTVPIMNPYAYGNAWFVDKIDYVDNADQEIDGLKTIDPRHEAIADKHFKDALGNTAEQTSQAIVKLEEYQPNQLTYSVESERGGIVVFSEIYYPGWTATVDGKPATLGRADYVLRAMNVAPGNHKVVLTFKPTSIKTTETVAYLSYALLLLALAGALVAKRKRK